MEDKVIRVIVSNRPVSVFLKPLFHRIKSVFITASRWVFVRKKGDGNDK